MSTIAFDGKIVAADLQGTYRGTPYRTHKIWKLDSGEICGSVGNLAEGLLMRDWYAAGADPEEYPEEMQDEDCDTEFLVFSPTDGHVKHFGKCKRNVEMDINCFAWGSGSDYAIGAMAAGKNAIDAIGISTEWDIHTGIGVEWFYLDGSHSGNSLL